MSSCTISSFDMGQKDNGILASDIHQTHADTSVSMLGYIQEFTLGKVVIFYWDRRICPQTGRLGERSNLSLKILDFATDGRDIGRALECGGANKFGVMGKLSCHKGKKGWLMDGVVMKQCFAILKKLMTHEAGWIFNQPVDPVELKIPDYFSIISKPMDLGTVRSRLESGFYFNSDEFAADVRLTFSNARQYNPPYNDVHIIAKELNDLFNLRWKSFETMWRESSMTLEQPISKKTQKQTPKSRLASHRTSSHCSNSSPRRSMAFTEKQILRKDITELLNGNAPPHLLKILRKFGTVSPNRDRVNIDFDALNDKVLWELNKIVKSCPKPTSNKPTVIDNKRGCGSGRELLKGKVQNDSVISCNSKSSTSTKGVFVRIKGSHDRMDHCSDFNKVSSSG
ncbi:hypothetical protein ACLOJK_040618 [Asimina triloba]